MLRYLAVLLWFAHGCGSAALPPLEDEPTWSLEISPCWNFQLDMGDLDGDGYVDLVVGRANCGWWPGEPTTPAEIVVFAGTESGFEAEPVARRPLSGQEFDRVSIAVLDIDGDGRDDLYLHESVDDSAALYLGTASWSDLFDNTFSTTRLYYSLIGDIDGDGRDELIDIDDGRLIIRDWINTELGWFSDSYAMADDVRWLGDHNEDGAPDLIAIAGSDYRIIYGCPSISCLVGGTLADQALPSFDSMPQGVGDVNDDGRSDLTTRSVGGAVRLHLSTSSGSYSLDPSWIGVPTSLEPFVSLRRAGDFDGDGSHGDLVVTSGYRTLLFASSGGVPQPEPVYEWFGYSGVALDPNDNQQMMFYQHPAESTRGPIRLVAFARGSVPNNTPVPEFATEFACELRDVDAADIGVDRDLIAGSLAIHRQEFDATSCEITEGCVGGEGERRLLDFSVAVQNMGSGLATIPGPEVSPELWAFDECHGHQHLTGFATYELLDAAGDAVVAGHKQGYYVIDVFPYCDLPSVTTDGDYFSISPGWSDIYSAGLACQWIDITDVIDGDYTLRVEVNANGAIPEDDVVSNVAEVRITIGGDDVTVATAL